MTDNEHLDRIKAKCLLIASGDYRPSESLPPMATVTVAMAHSTLAAIDEGQQLCSSHSEDEYGHTCGLRLLNRTRAAWPEELL